MLNNNAICFATTQNNLLFPFNIILMFACFICTKHNHLAQTNFMPKHLLLLVVITHIIPVLSLQIQQSFVGTITHLARALSNFSWMHLFTTNNTSITAFKLPRRRIQFGSTSDALTIHTIENALPSSISPPDNNNY